MTMMTATTRLEAETMTEANTTNFTVPEVAERLRVSMDTLNRWRGNGKGPVYVKAGGRVLYREADLKAYEEQNSRTRTRPTS